MVKMPASVKSVILYSHRFAREWIESENRAVALVFGAQIVRGRAQPLRIGRSSLSATNYCPSTYVCGRLMNNDA